MQPIPIRVHGEHRSHRHRHRAPHSRAHRVFRRALIATAVVAAISVLTVLIMARPASAATAATVQTPGPGSGIPNPPAVDDLPTVITNARNWFIGILSALMLFFFTLGAARYIAGGSDPSETERAKGLMKTSVLGYVLAMMASVVLTIIQQIIGVK